jgi:RHS repeat-associated protein
MLGHIKNSNTKTAFGSLMPQRSFASEGYRFGFNGMEKDDEVKGSGNSLDFGARIYDSRFGRWLSLDPLAQKYPELSPYNFVAGNPILYIDPDGKIIEISYKENVDGKEVAKTFIYEYGKEYIGDNEFVSSVVESLNYIVDNGADVNTKTNEKPIMKVLETKDVITIVETKEYGSGKTGFKSGDKTVTWNTNEATIVGEIDNKGNPLSLDGTQSPAIGLFHEIGHAYNYLKNPSEYKDRRDKKVKLYDNAEEKEVIDNMETPAILILQQKGKTEKIRKNHGGQAYKVDGSTDAPQKDELKKENVQE